MEIAKITYLNLEFCRAMQENFNDIYNVNFSLNSFSADIPGEKIEGILPESHNIETTSEKLFMIWGIVQMVGLIGAFLTFNRNTSCSDTNLCDPYTLFFLTTAIFSPIFLFAGILAFILKSSDNNPNKKIKLSLNSNQNNPLQLTLVSANKSSQFNEQNNIKAQKEKLICGPSVPIHSIHKRSNPNKPSN